MQRVSGPGPGGGGQGAQEGAGEGGEAPAVPAQPSLQEALTKELESR